MFSLFYSVHLLPCMSVRCLLLCVCVCVFFMRSLFWIKWASTTPCFKGLLKCIFTLWFCLSFQEFRCRPRHARMNMAAEALFTGWAWIRFQGSVCACEKAASKVSLLLNRACQTLPGDKVMGGDKPWKPSIYVCHYALDKPQPLSPLNSYKVMFACWEKKSGRKHRHKMEKIERNKSVCRPGLKEHIGRSNLKS